MAIDQHEAGIIEHRTGDPFAAFVSEEHMYGPKFDPELRPHVELGADDIVAMKIVETFMVESAPSVEVDRFADTERGGARVMHPGIGLTLSEAAFGREKFRRNAHRFWLQHNEQSYTAMEHWTMPLPAVNSEQAIAERDAYEIMLQEAANSYVHQGGAIALGAA
jgi:hypothetical protein